jgi:hypothetical protein
MDIAADSAALNCRMEKTMTKSKIIAATLAAVTVAGAVVSTSAPAQARHRHHHYGPALGIGLAIGTIAAAAAASNAYYAEPAYECRYVKRYNRWGELRVVKVCEAY